MRGAPGGNIDFAIPGVQDGDGQVGGRAEAEKADALPWLDAGYAEASETDDAGTQQRRGIQIAEGLRQRVDEVCASEGVLGIASVNRVAGVRRGIAEVFLASLAIGAGSVDASQPRYSDPGAGREVSFDDLAYYLVARDQRAAEGLEFAFDDMQIGAADSAGANAQQDVTRAETAAC